MLPVEQTCPTCHTRFMGSDMVGDPCLGCIMVEAAEKEKGSPLTEDERMSVYYSSMSTQRNIDLGEVFKW